MGIEQVYRSVKPDIFHDLMQHPEKAEAFFYGSLDDDEVMLDFRAELESSEQFCDLGKDWQAIHFLLTGECASSGKSKIPPPMSHVVLGGTGTPFECTYGFVRFLTPQEVQAVADALNHITEDDLRQNLIPHNFNTANIYPAGNKWDRNELESLLSLYGDLDEFYQKAADEGNYVLISLE